MKKKHLIITLTSVCVLIVLGLLISYVSKSHAPNPEPQEPIRKEVSESVLVNKLSDVTIPFEDLKTIDVHRSINGLLYISLLQDCDSIPLGSATKELGYIDLDTMQYTRVKSFDTSTRVFDYVYTDGVLIYSKIGALEDDGIDVKVIREENGVVTEVDQMKTLWGFDTPILAFIDDQIFYHYKHVEESAENGVTTTMAFKKYDMAHVTDIESHVCFTDLSGGGLYGTDCIRSDGRVSTSDNSVYYLSTNGVTSALNIYNTKSTQFETVIFDDFVPWAAYNDETRNIIFGEYIDKDTELVKLRSYNIDSKEYEDIFPKIDFARSVIHDNKLIFLDEYSSNILHTIILNLDTYEYQKIKGFDTFIGFPKYYVHNNKVYAVWSNKSVDMQVFEFVE